jgi:cell division protein FtsQ
MSTKKINIKKVLLTLLWVITGVGTTVLLVAAVRTKNAKLCKGIEININGVNKNFFIDKKDVLDIINQNSTATVKGKTIESFNLLQMESHLEKDVWIKDAELYFDNNNVLQVNIEEREPIARIFSVGGNTFYIDSSAMMLPLSDKFSARVPVFTDFPSEVKVLTKVDSSLLFDIRNISMQLLNNDFLMAMIDQVDITTERNFVMIPKIGKQTIVFGDASNAAAKFKKLELFYKNIIPHTGWNHYINIDLQYDNQVVAKIRGKDDVAADSLRTLQLMKAMAANAAKASSDSIQTFAPDNDNNSTDTSLIQQSLQRDEEAEPSISNSNEEPSPQEDALSTSPKSTSEKPATKPILKPTIKKTIVAKPALKTTITKPNQKTEKRIPKAVMKPNDY